jgi:hypothetical protein
MQLCELDLSVHYRPGNAAEILAIMDRRKTKRTEDTTYALVGIFSIHLTLTYGEGEKARERLLHALATQKGDLSVLSFASETSEFSYLPAPRRQLFLAAQCRKASTPAIISHFGFTIKVQLVTIADAHKILVGLNNLKILKKLRTGILVGVTNMMEMIQQQENSTSASIKIAIFSDIRL